MKQKLKIAVTIIAQVLLKTIIKEYYHINLFNLCNLSVLVDCVWSTFGKWSDCSTTCGGGTRFSTRTIIQQSLHGGKECKGEDTQSENCNEAPCPGKTSQTTSYNQENI